MLDEHGRMRRRERERLLDEDEPGERPPREGVLSRLRALATWPTALRQRRLIIVGMAAILIAILAIVALPFVLARLSPEQSGEDGSGGEPATKRAPRVVAPSKQTSEPVGASSKTETGPAAPDPWVVARSAGVHEPVVAYRREGAIWVVSEKGESPRRVLAAGPGVYALSPDGAKLAVVDGTSGRLAIVDTVTGARKEIGEAAAERPEWSPDSQWLLYTRPLGGDAEVVRVAAGGFGETALMRAAGGRFAGGPELVAAAPRRSTLPSQVVAVLSDGRTLRLPKSMSSVEVCPAPHGVYFVDAGGGTQAPSIKYVGYESGSELTVVPAPTGSGHISFSGLSVSPDGKWLVFHETGDDGYSRMFARQSSSLKSVALKTHRDSYLLGWSADGTEILRIEGNAAQGESTRLTALHPDGTGWRVVAEGAGL